MLEKAISMLFASFIYENKKKCRSWKRKNTLDKIRTNISVIFNKIQLSPIQALLKVV